VAFLVKEREGIRKGQPMSIGKETNSRLHPSGA